MAKLTVNGRPFTERAFRDILEAAAYGAVVGRVRGMVARAAGDDADAVSVDIHGTSISGLSFTVSGPEGAVAKVREAFAA